MKLFKIAVLLIVSAVAFSGEALAHGHARIGVVIGAPFYPWAYAPYYPPYYPPVVVQQAAPPVYVEQAPAAAAASNTWYYCAAAGAYYPYVKDCAGGWQAVPAQPPAQ